MDALRENIARAEGVAKENIFCGNGSDEILALCFPAFFDSDGEGAAFAEITYSFYPVFCDFFKVKAHTIEMEEDLSLDLAKLTAAKAQGVLVANPNAPTGISIPLDEMEAFIRANAARVVIVDEAYMPFFNQSAVSLVKKYPNLVVVKTFSKGYSLAGMRCGYAVADLALIDGLERVKDCFNSYPVDRVCQAVCAAAIADKSYYNERNAIVVSERERVSETLAKRDLPFFRARRTLSLPRINAFRGGAFTKNCARGACSCAILQNRKSKISAASRSVHPNRTTRCLRRSTKFYKNSKAQKRRERKIEESLCAL